MKIVVLVSLLSWFVLTSLAACEVVATFDMPAGGISALGYGNGSLWGSSPVSYLIYKLNPATCAIQDSWYPSGTPRGLTFANNSIYLSDRDDVDPHCYRYSPTGDYIGKFSLNC